MDERPEDEDQTTEKAFGTPDGVRIIGAKEAAEALDGDSSSEEEILRPLGAPASGTPASGASGAGAPASMLPHWTDPPTGEVPRVFADSRDDARSDFEHADEEDDLDAWMGVSNSSPRWRDHPNDWDEPDYVDVVKEVVNLPGGNVGPDDFPADPPAERPDFFSPSFDPQPDFVASSSFSRPAPRIERGVSTAGPRTGPGPRPGGPFAVERGVSPYAQDDDGPEEADIRVRAITGLGMAAISLILFSMGPATAVLVALVVVVAAAAELYAMLQRGGYQPATLVGLVATASLVMATYWKGTMALPLVIALTVITTLLWYMMGITGGASTLNVGITVLGVGYVGVLGSFASLILRFDNGVGILIGLIVVVVANDVGALFVGRRFGTSPFVPHISPHKTREGLVGGAFASVVSSVLVLGVVGLHPWSVSSAILLGLVVSVVAPLGDLCESMIKRDIGVKDAGNILPGHGGALDRFDALLFALPAVYYLCLLIEVF